MEVVIYNPIGASKGHSKIYTSGIINGFTDKSIKLTLITSKDFNQSLLIRKDIKIIKINQITSKEIKKTSLLGNIKYGYFLLKNSLKSFKYLINHNNKNCIYLLIGGNTLFNSLFLIFAKNKKNYGLTIHNADYNLNLYKRDFLKLFYKLLNKIILKILIKSDLKIFCHGEFTKRELAKNLNTYQERLDSYLNPIDNSFNREKKSRLKSHTKKNFNLLFFGIIREDKGLDILINALNLCFDIKYNLYICGNPEQIGFDKVNAILESSNQAGNIKKEFGYVTDAVMEKYFFESSYVILPYRKTFTALSVVFSDSIKRFKPVICTELSQNGFDTKKYNLGETFRSEDVLDLSLAIKSAYYKWQKKDLPPKKNFMKYLEDSSPVNVTNSILKKFEK